MNFARWLLQAATNHSTALLALGAIASPFIALFALLRATKSQMKSAVAAHRQDWINELRNETANAQNCVTRAIATKSIALTAENRLSPVIEFDLHFEKIQLLINPDEKDHVELCKLLAAEAQSLGDYLKSNQDDRTTLTNIARTITTLSPPLLKREWKRVKRGGETIPFSWIKQATRFVSRRLKTPAPADSVQQILQRYQTKGHLPAPNHKPTD